MRFLSGLVSGALLSAYCPETGPRDSRLMWLIITLMALSSPVLMILLKKVIVPDGNGHTADQRYNKIRYSIPASGGEDIALLSPIGEVDEEGEDGIEMTEFHS